MSRFLALITVLLLTLTSVGLTEEPFTIGWIGPLTGDAAFLGVDSVDVAKRTFAAVSASEKLHGRKVRFVAEDDQYQASKTISAYKKLVQIDQAKVIFIITYGGMIAVAPLAEKDNVLLINPLDCDEELAALPKNSFCVAKKTEDLGITTAQHALSHNNFPAAIIYADGDPFEPKVAKATKETFEKAGHPVVMFEGLSGKSLDFRSLLLRAKELKAKSIFYYGYDDFGVAMKQARELRLEAVPYALTSINSPGFLAGAGDSVNGTFAAGWFAPRTPAYENFLNEHRASVGREPLLEVSTVPTYDMAQIIIDGLESVDFSSSTSSVAQLRDYFYGVKNFDGLSGKITMDPDGAVRTLKTGMYSYRGGKFVPEN